MGLLSALAVKTLKEHAVTWLIAGKRLPGEGHALHDICAVHNMSIQSALKVRKVLYGTQYEKFQTKPSNPSSHVLAFIASLGTLSSLSHVLFLLEKQHGKVQSLILSLRS